jgi:hypothetical protein
MKLEVIYGVAILFLVSIIVRIFPSVLPLAMPEKIKNNIKSHLSVAVLINLFVYSVYSELVLNGWVAIASIILLISCLNFFREGVVFVSILVASVFFLWAKNF